jgi:hypothetical protein
MAYGADGVFAPSAPWVLTSSTVDDEYDLRTAPVLSVLYDRYAAETRTDRGKFARKISLIRSQLDRVLGRIRFAGDARQFR